MKRENILKIIVIRYVLLFFAVFVVVFVGLGHCQVSPILGNVGNVQVFDNNGVVCPQCVLYVYVAGTTTQAPTFSDSTGTIQNPNPITFSSGARASIWLTTGAFYKLVLCVQNDGPSACAPADVLFSSDQVPGGASGGGGGGGSPFISGSSNPATTGILRLAAGDSICWRNVANSANLCISKDTSDVLNWAGGAIKFPQINCSNTASGFDYLCASSSNNRWVMANNGGAQTQIVGAGVDINTSDQVTQLHFGPTATPLGVAPANGQFLQWTGATITGLFTEFVWSTPLLGVGTVGACGSGGSSGIVCVQSLFPQSHAITRFNFFVTTAAVGCSTNATVGIVDKTASSTLETVTVTQASGTFFDSGPLSIAMTAGDRFTLGIIQAPIGCSTVPVIESVSAILR